MHWGARGGLELEFDDGERLGRWRVAGCMLFFVNY
jgi:hypothetical protein